MPLWADGFPAPGIIDPVALALDSKGNSLVALQIEGTVDLGNGPISSNGAFFNLVVVKLDCSGNLVWAKLFGDGGTVFGVGGLSIAVTSSDAVVVGGAFDGGLDIGKDPLVAVGGGTDAFVIELDTDGNPLWARRYGGMWNDRTFSVAGDKLGNVIASGSVGNKLDYGGGFRGLDGAQNLFLLKLDATGNHVWSTVPGGSGTTANLAIDGASNILIAGQGGPLDFGGGLLATPESIFTAKLAPDGSHLWSSSYPGATTLYCSGAAVDGLGNLAITGYESSGPDFGMGQLPWQAGPGRNGFVAKIDAAGKPVWSHGFFAPQNDLYTGGVAFDASGNVFIDGAFDGSIDFGLGSMMEIGLRDIFLVKYAPAGNVLESRDLGGTSYDLAVALAVDGATPVLLGVYGASFDFGSGALPDPMGNLAPFLARVAP